MDASWKSSFEEELLCPICLNVFDEPVQLPCKHNFCKACISEAWAKENAAARCPECNRDYDQKPTLEKNLKLANIVKRFDALSTEKVPALLHCVLCRRGPPLPVRKVCLRCKEPCCQTHIQTHLEQPCAAPGHLLVDAEELKAWTCPHHEEYRLLHCQEEQVALCPFCCISHCTNQRHTVCDVDTQRIQTQAMLMRQQDKLEGRVQNIDEQLMKLESDKTLMKDAVSELKECVKEQYQRMHALLEADQAESVRLLERAHTAYRRKNAQQALQLSESRQEAEKLLGSARTLTHRVGNIHFMKNTKSYQLLMDRTNLHLSVPLLRMGQLSSHHILSQLSAREKDLRKILHEPLSEASILQIVHSHSSSTGFHVSSSGLQKRKYNTAFLERDPENSSSHSPPLLTCSSKKPSLAEQSHHAPPVYSSDGLSQNPHVSHGRLLDSLAPHVVGLGSSSSHHVPSSGASQRAVLQQYEGRKVLMCTLSNCCCSWSPAARGHPSFPASDSFPSMTSQEFLHAPLPAAQPVQHFPVRRLMEASQTARQPDFYGPYDQTTKRYATK
ncbi:hypothetical protein LDENG_00256810 [Lucifuga dentata]|nr:hypothetical protein LDENG_00256810 [Lucifuga dentata]